MTHARKHAPRLAALTAAIAALLLAGCSSGHIGDSWQCPLAKGGACDSVAAADPAVPDAARKTVLTEPLWRVRDEVSAEPPPARGPGQACAADCGGGFDPFGWLMRLFRAEAGESETGTSDRTARKPEPAAGETAVAPSAAGTGEAQPGEPAVAALPAGPASSEDDPDGDGLRGDDLRTGEIVARIWIAPFVDADGVYREASHVRVVLEPAGWRLK